MMAPTAFCLQSTGAISGLQKPTSRLHRVEDHQKPTSAPLDQGSDRKRFRAADQEHPTTGWPSAPSFMLVPEADMIGPFGILPSIPSRGRPSPPACVWTSYGRCCFKDFNV